MSILQDLSDIKYRRIIVMGEILGDHDRMMTILYEQQFNFEDILISTGNLIDIESPRKSIEVLDFFANNSNCYAIRGMNESLYLKYKYDDKLIDKIPSVLRDEMLNDLQQFVYDLPLIIKLPHYYYVVHAGVDPQKSILEQDPEVYYSIGNFDKDSRFYQFNNPDKKDWYEFRVFDGSQEVDVVFSSQFLNGAVTVPAGYCLGRINPDHDAIRCLILSNKDKEPFIVETK